MATADGSYEFALRARIMADGAVRAIAATRVDWTNRPAGEGFPAVGLTTVYDPRPRHMKGPVGFRGVRVQIDCWARDARTKRALREAVLAAIEPSGVFSGVRFGGVRSVEVRDLGEDADGAFLHRDSIDAVIWNDG